MRPLAAQQEASPAVLRLLLESGEGADALTLRLLKRRGPPLTTPLVLPARPERLQALLAASRQQSARRRQGQWRGPACRRPGCPAAGQRGAGGAGAHPRPCWRGPIRRSRCTGSPCCPCRPLRRRPHTGQDEALRLWSWRALQFTPRVALADGVVVLEISASERLFGGRRAFSGNFLNKISLIPAWNGHKALHL
jgi:hypothetical protein